MLASLTEEFQNEVELISLREYEAPLFNSDLLEEEGVPESIQKLMEKMKGSDGFVISIAEHNGSMTAVLKNTFDWLSMLEMKFMLNKPTVFLSTSPGPRGGVTALNHIIDIMPYRGANIVGKYSVGNFNENFQNGKLNGSNLSNIKIVIGILENAMKEEVGFSETA